VQRHGPQVIVGDGGDADGLAAAAGGFVAFQGPVAEYSRSIPDRAASTVKTIPDGSCDP